MNKGGLSYYFDPKLFLLTNQIQARSNSKDSDSDEKNETTGNEQTVGFLEEFCRENSIPEKKASRKLRFCMMENGNYKTVQSTTLHVENKGLIARWIEVSLILTAGDYVNIGAKKTFILTEGKQQFSMKFDVPTDKKKKLNTFYRVVFYSIDSNNNKPKEIAKFTEILHTKDFVNGELVESDFIKLFSHNKTLERHEPNSLFVKELKKRSKNPRPEPTEVSFSSKKRKSQELDEPKPKKKPKHDPVSKVTQSTETKSKKEKNKKKEEVVPIQEKVVMSSEDQSNQEQQQQYILDERTSEQFYQLKFYNRMLKNDCNLKDQEISLLQQKYNNLQHEYEKLKEILLQCVPRTIDSLDRLAVQK